MLWQPHRAFDGQPLTALLDIQRVSLGALAELQRQSGNALFTSPYWLWNEAIRLLALTGLQASGGVAQMQQALRKQEEWMLKLGAARSAA